MRHGCVRTLTGVLLAHVAQLDARAWRGCVRHVPLPLLAAEMPGGCRKRVAEGGQSLYLTPRQRRIRTRPRRPRRRRQRRKRQRGNRLRRRGGGHRWRAAAVAPQLIQTRPAVERDEGAGAGRRGARPSPLSCAAHRVSRCGEVKACAGRVGRGSCGYQGRGDPCGRDGAAGLAYRRRRGDCRVHSRRGRRDGGKGGRGRKGRPALYKDNGWRRWRRCRQWRRERLGR